MSGRLKVRERLLVWLVGAVGPFWIRRARGILGRRRSRGLTEGERGSVAAWFDESLLDRARVAIVDEVMLPAPWARRLGGLLGGEGIVLDRPSAIALRDLVVVSSKAAADGEVPRSLLFHELVHLAQYDALGLRRFARAYALGWVLADRNYYGIPLEREAFELQRRFEAGEQFCVREEIGRV